MATFEFENNNTEFTATTGLLGTTIGGQLHSTGDVDYFKFTITSSENATLTFKPPVGADANSFQLLISGPGVGPSQTNGADASYSFSAVPGVYYVRVSYISTDPNDPNNIYVFNSNDYGISLTTNPSVLANGEIESNDTTGSATPFLIGTGTPLIEPLDVPIIIGTLSSGADKDYFSFNIAVKGTYTFNFKAPENVEPPTPVDPAVDAPGTIKEFFKVSILDSNSVVLVSHYVSSIPEDGFKFDFGADVVGGYYVLIEAGGSTVINTQQYEFEINPTELADDAAVTLHGADLKDYLLGTSANDYISGHLGNDILISLDGNDNLDGGGGIDTLKGGMGNDTYYVDSASDLVIENSGDGLDLVISTANISSLAKNVENLQLAAAVTSPTTGKTTGATSGTGNTLDNQILGNELANTLKGLDGNDTLDGGLGLKGDALTGGLGNDTYYINNTLDKVTESANQGTDLVVARVNIAALASNVENLKLLDMGFTDINSPGGGGPVVAYGTGNTLNNTIEGNNNYNHLNGLGGNDTLYGRGGNDAINGGLGNDTLQGDSGSDIFIFNTALSATTNVDSIADFESGIDHIYLSKLDPLSGVALFSKLVGPAGNDFNGEVSSTNFVSSAGTPVAGDADDYLLFSTTTGNLYYDSDGSGVKAAVLFASVGPSVDLTINDFTVV